MINVSITLLYGGTLTCVKHKNVKGHCASDIFYEVCMSNTETYNYNINNVVSIHVVEVEDK